jgi:phosphosulfolactate phosphohydrolase-like enzyme
MVTVPVPGPTRTRAILVNWSASLTGTTTFNDTHSTCLTHDEDSSIAAKYLYLSAKDNYFGYLKSSSHRRRLKNLNLNEDIKYCLTPDQTDVIPILRDGKLVKL